MAFKKVLIICYYWPPAGGPGVQRWLKFVKYFKQFNIQPVVFVPENATYPIIDFQLENEVPNDIEIIKFPISEPYRFLKLFSKKKVKQMSSGLITKNKPSFFEKLLLFIRGNFFIPDARVGWVKPSVKFLKNYLKKHQDIDTIITSGPPHSLHLIGKKLQEQLPLKWLADFRDPWTSIHYHKSLQLSKNAQKRHNFLEQSILNAADAIVVTSNLTKKEFEAITQKPITVITNGFDTIELPSVNKDNNSKFTIAHIGSLLAGRNPIVLWDALYELTLANEDFKNDLQLQLIGVVAEEIKLTIEKHHLKNFTAYTGYVSHQEVLKFQFKANVLLLIEINTPETKAIIPGKLFEYLQAQSPIIAIGPEGGEVNEIIEHTKSGNYFNYTDKEKIKQCILQHYKYYKTNNKVFKSVGISQYSRENLTKQMAKLIQSL